MSEEIREDSMNVPIDEVEDSQAASQATDEEPMTVEAQLEKAVAESEDYKDRWMRAQAEFANARKRMEKQRQQSYQNTLADLTGKLLPAIDDFERAVENVPQDVEANSWFEGIELVHRKLNTILEGFDVQPIDAVGQPFDPNIHEAITMEPSDEVESGTVLRELQKGYMIGERVIRPSLVIVSQ